MGSSASRAVQDWRAEVVNMGRCKVADGARSLHAGFVGFPTKPSVDSFLVWTSKPSPEARGDGDGDPGASGSFEAGARGVIAGLASMLSKAAVEACPLDEDLTKMPLRGCIFIYVVGVAWSFTSL